ncbi:Pimeloyl-ACP methyl ester carboxylesterase [Gracilibacillus ureilyticus]|uniref:Pimeloyl-ACP methyl ester carboxylesterase n=1 Tax=Gracilibacillus ureilyticus TaxID=531814 RepID=A0A1H9S0H9_9BACI|nr:alpha/beta hydrolase [Gracilibacillus ureilyticus]SER77843.1 Pimeloyl-ACP methyl ester carboxylesterase [Gracilibacillus ureilyticus]
MTNYIWYKEHSICYEIHPATNISQPNYLVLLHGFLASKYCFRHLIPSLTENNHIISIDIPPFGKSSKNKNNLYTYDHIVKAIFFLLDQLKINKVSIIGHSMGGQIALRCSYYYTERIKKLFLLAPCSFMHPSPLFARLISSNPLIPVIAKKFLKTKGVFEILRQCMYNDALITEEMLEQYKEPFKDEAIYRSIMTWLKDHKGDLVEEQLITIKTPCSIFWGTDDLILPYELGYDLLKCIQNAKLYLFSEVGHFLPEEIPARIVHIIQGELKT